MGRGPIRTGPLGPSSIWAIKIEARSPKNTGQSGPAHIPSSIQYSRINFPYDQAPFFNLKYELTQILIQIHIMMYPLNRQETMMN